MIRWKTSASHAGATYSISSVLSTSSMNCCCNSEVTKHALQRSANTWYIDHRSGDIRSGNAMVSGTNLSYGKTFIFAFIVAVADELEVQQQRGVRHNVDAVGVQYHSVVALVLV